MLVYLTLAGHLSDEPGYFSFGQGSVCFGRSSAGSPAKVQEKNLPLKSRS